MPEMIADRFLIGSDRRAVDLASGDEAMLMSSTAGGATDEKRWAMRCDWFFRLRHPAIAELVDYGALGEHQRFEAWRCGREWDGSPEEARRVLDVARSFLAANGLSTEELTERAIRTRDGTAVVVPSAASGAEVEPGRWRRRSGLEHRGLVLIDRPAVATIADVFTDMPGCQSRMLALGAAASGAGLRTAVRVLARVARLNGFVPLSLRLAADVADLLTDRTVFAIADGAHAGREWRRFLEWTIRSPRPHVLLFTGAAAIARIQTLWLDRVAPETLLGAVRPGAIESSDRRRLELAARRSRGLPGRFAAFLWGRPVPAHREQRPSRPFVAAERPDVYGVQTLGIASKPSVTQSSAWPAPGEVHGLSRKMEESMALLAAGRRASGERILRASVAGLARRHAWHDAARGSLALASSLIRRGCPRLAQQVLRDGADYCREAGDDRGMLDVAVLSGRAWMDVGRLDEAESVLRTTLTASASIRTPTGGWTSRLELARCLFWGGRYEEARRALPAAADDAISDVESLRRSVALARIAVGCRDLELAVSGALAAMARAEALRDPALVAEAACAVAFAHLATGDHAAVERDVATAIRSARAARDPLRALRARLLGVESDRRLGRQRAATALVGRIGRLPASSLPATVRARAALLSDLLSSPFDDELIKRHVKSTGLEALALYAPHEPRPAAESRIVADEVIEILRLCHTGDDDLRVLTSVCALVRAQLKAASVAFFVAERGCLVPVASDGHPRLDPEMAGRVIAAGQTLPPHLGHDALEGGAPIHLAGDTAGALVGRWTVGSSQDPGRSALILSTAAAAAGPAVAALLARRLAPRVARVDEMLGHSRAMQDVRRSVERAAAAPFAVLIEGESGSGKELVARALHRLSPRRDRPFCTLNCAALPDDLVEAELFGHARGAFTGAIAERSGVFEDAHTGTLFLDEIGELSPRAQAKILRTIQEGELRRVGENVARRVDVRIVSATNRDLRKEVAAGRFRLDLLYRLDVLRLTLPPLRERREDIAVLVEQYWRDAAERIGSRAVLSTATLAALAQYDWPGNVREVQNVMASLAVRSPRRGVVGPTALPPVFGCARPSSTWRLEEARRTFDEGFVRAALVRSGGHRARAAEELGVTRQGLTKLMSRLGIADEHPDASATLDSEPAGGSVEATVE
jgi:DNA-binding NtrC family response regulator